MARSAARSLTSLWKDGSLNLQLKSRLMQSLVWSVATYGCESWTIRGENYSTSATWFKRIISARTFYMALLPEKDAEEDHRDAGLTTSSNGLEYLSQCVFSTQRTEARGEPWCLCQWPPILSHEDGPRQGKAMANYRNRGRLGHNGSQGTAKETDRGTTDSRNAKEMECCQ